MITWKYIIKGDEGTIITKDHRYAEEKSRLGYRVFCKQEKNIYKCYH